MDRAERTGAGVFVHLIENLYRVCGMRFELVSPTLCPMSAALSYICGRCLMRLREKPAGEWTHAVAPNCGRDPVPMFRPMHRERLRQDRGAGHAG